MFLFIFIEKLKAITFGPLVQPLHKLNWNTEIMERDNKTVYVVLIHSPSSPSCFDAYPDYVSASKLSPGLIRFGHLDTTFFAHFARNNYNVTKLPTYLVFHPKGITEYNGDRTPRSMVNFASQFIPNHSKEVNESWRQPTELKSVILFSEKSIPPPFWNSVSCFYEDTDINIGFVNNKTIQSHFHIKKLPTILMIRPGVTKIYDELIDLKKFNQTMKVFFSRKRGPKQKKSEKLIQIQNITSKQMFNSECRGHGYYCVLESNYTASPLIINMTRKFVHDPLKFFLCKEKCPLKWLTNGRYVIHPKRNEIVNIT